MSTPRKPATARPDWRSRVHPSDLPRKGKWPRRVLYTLTSIFLIGFLVYLLLPSRSPPTHLAFLPVSGYDISIPPVPFSEVDAREFSAAPLTDSRALTSLQDSENLARLADQWPTFSGSGSQRTILYVAAHGVSQNGRALLLCSDFLRAGRTASAPGVCDLRAFLDQVRQCPAQLKLVVLDCSAIDSDARLGMVVNEFPGIAEREVRATPDPSLWVLLACQPLQVSHLSYADLGEARGTPQAASEQSAASSRVLIARSTLARVLGEALRGAADGARDGQTDSEVDLDEFVRFVRDGIGALSRQEGRLSPQTPVLLHGEVGVSEPPANLVLYRLPRSVARSEAKAESKTESKTETPPRAVQGNATAAEPAPRPAAEPRVTLASAQTLLREVPPTQAAPAQVPATAADAAPPSDAKVSPDKVPPTAAMPPKTAPTPAAKREPAQDASANAPGSTRPGNAETLDAPRTEAGSRASQTPSAPRTEAGSRASQTPSAPRTDSTASPRRARRELLEFNWRWRDQVQTRAAVDAWSPVDYAPHLWREYLGLLLNHELHYRYGSTWSGEHPLASLKESVEKRLAVEAEAAASAQARFRQAPEELRGIEEAVKLKDDLCFAAPYYCSLVRRLGAATATDAPRATRSENCWTSWPT